MSALQTARIGHVETLPNRAVGFDLYGLRHCVDPMNVIRVPSPYDSWRVRLEARSAGSEDGSPKPVKSTK